MQSQTDYVGLDEFDQSHWRHFEAEKWTANKDQYLKHISKCWGKFPRVDNQQAVYMGEEQKDGYRLEKYELMVSSTGNTKDDFTSVWVLIPESPRESPCPTMIVHHQHAGRFEKGKEEPAGVMGDPQQAFAVELVKQGYIVATFDALGFSDRQEEGGERFSFERLLLYGMTLNGKYCFDTSAVLTMLETFPNVDKDRIGIMGHGLGGQQAIWGGLFDLRLKVIICSCGVGRYTGPDSILNHHINHNFAAYLPNFLDPNVGIDMFEVIGQLCPRPLLISNGVMDKLFPIEGVAEIHNWLEDLYASEGVSGKFGNLTSSFWPLGAA